MTEFLLPPGFQATNSDDSPLAGGYYLFFSAGTTTPKAVYSDSGRSVSLGTQVNLNSSGAPVSGSNVPVLIYLGTGTYKVALYDADDTLLYTFDNIPGYVEEEEAATTALPVIPVDSKTTTYTVVAGDKSNLINCNPTGGSFPVFLPSAVTVGDGFLVGFKHNGTANSVTLVATGSQNIRFQGNRTAFSLVGQGEVIWLLADGSDWNCVGYAPPFRKATDPYFIILDQLTSPPANPSAGARYLVNGTATGAWSTLSFAEHDIAEADGNGSWIKHTPAEGWMAFDADEKISLVYKNGAWENFQIDPGTSTLKSAMVQDQKTSGTVGGTATATTWTDAVLNTAVFNTIDGASLAANTITLPAGPDGAARRYRIRARKTFYRTEKSQIRIITAGGSVVARSEVVNAGYLDGSVSANAFVGATAMCDGEIEITESTDIKLQYYVSVTRSTEDLGTPASISATNEIYATVVVEDLTAQQGPTGPQGGVGEGGLDAAYAYQFNTATSGDPGTGKIRTNHATPASVTQIAVHQTDANGGVLTSVIATWDDSTSANKARIRFHKEGSPQNFFEFLITGSGTDVGDYWTFPVSYVSHGGTISNGNDIAMLVVPVGDKGDPGTTVPDISGLAELDLTAIDRVADRLIIYDNSVGTHKKFAIPMMSIDVTHPSFGADATGTTDSAPAIQEAIDYVAGLGGGIVHVPPGDYRIETMLDMSDPGVCLKGVGGGTPHDIGSANGHTRFNWYGSSGGTMLKVHTVFGTASTRVNDNMGVEGLMLNCRRIAGYGLDIVSVRSSKFSNLFVLDPTTTAYRTRTGVTGTDFGEAADVTGCIFENLKWRAIDHADVQSAHGVHMQGSTNANTSFNTWISCSGQTHNGHGWNMECADSNVLIGCGNVNTGTGRDFNLHGTTAVTNPVGGDNNTFIHCTWGTASGDFYIGGTDVYGGAVLNNVILAWDEANSAAMPTLGTGASYISPTRGELLTVKGVATNSNRRVRDIASSAAYQVLRVNSANTALAFGAIDGTQTAALAATWTAYVPTATANSGTLGTYTINKARYCRLGNRVEVFIDITITSAGSSPGPNLILTLPIPAASGNCGTAFGRENASTGNFVAGPVSGSSASLYVSMYSGASATVNGYQMTISAIYEAA